MPRVLLFFVWAVFLQLAYSSILKEQWLGVARSRFDARNADASSIPEREGASLPLQITSSFPLNKREAKGGLGGLGGSSRGGGGSSSGGRGGGDIDIPDFPDGGQHGSGSEHGGGSQSDDDQPLRFDISPTTSSRTRPPSRTTTTIGGTPFVILEPTLLPVSSAKDLFLPGAAGTTSNSIDFLVISATTSAQVLVVSTQPAISPASTTSSRARFGSSATTSAPSLKVVSSGMQNHASGILSLFCSFAFAVFLV